MRWPVCWWKTLTSKIAFNVTDQNVAEVLYVGEIQLFWSKNFDLDFLKNAPRLYKGSEQIKYPEIFSPLYCNKIRIGAIEIWVFHLFWPIIRKLKIISLKALYWVKIAKNVKNFHYWVDFWNNQKFDYRSISTRAMLIIFDFSLFVFQTRISFELKWSGSDKNRCYSKRGPEFIVLKWRKTKKPTKYTFNSVYTYRFGQILFIYKSTETKSFTWTHVFTNVSSVVGTPPTIRLTWPLLLLLQTTCATLTSTWINFFSTESSFLSSISSVFSLEVFSSGFGSGFFVRFWRLRFGRFVNDNEWSKISYKLMLFRFIQW